MKFPNNKPVMLFLQPILSRLVLSNGQRQRKHQTLNYVNRDFEMYSILIGTDANVCLSDFGLAQSFQSAIDASQLYQHQNKASTHHPAMIQEILMMIVPMNLWIEKKGKKCTKYTKIIVKIYHN